jgi:membrane protein
MVADVQAKLEKEKAAITAVSVLVIIWAALGLLTTIERAFNRIWHVSRGRGWLQRVVSYWTVLTLGPLLVGAGIYLGTRYALAALLRETVFFNAGPLVTCAISALVFFFLYLLMPNAKVSAKAAIWGAAVAALVWNVVKWGFGIYVARFIPYSQLYGIMGLIPLTVLWIYLTWLIVLFGLQLTFTTQHLKSLDAAEMAAARKHQQYFLATELTVMNIMALVASAFRSKAGPICSSLVCSRLDLPPQFGEQILQHLVSRGLLAKTSEPVAGFVPATDPENITLADIAAATADAGFGQSAALLAAPLQQVADTHRRMLAGHTLAEMLHTDSTGQSHCPAQSTPPTSAGE